LSKKTTIQTGFMTKPHRVQSFTQRVTVQNTKASALAKLKVIDQVPISEEAGILVKVVAPALTVVPSTTSGAASTASTSSKEKVTRPLSIAVPKSVSVGHDIVAQWEGLEDVVIEEGHGKDVSSIADGKFAWVCSNITSQAKINLVLQWEVSAPTSTDVHGL
jgi:tetrahydromethanopterin S-methyltransferase subunit H